MKQPSHTRTRNMEAARTVQRAAGAPCPNVARCAGRRGGARRGAQRGRAGAPGAGARPGRARRRRPAGPPGVPPGRAHGARAPHCRRCRGRAPAARLGGGCACGTRGGWEQWVACCRRGAESFGQLSQHIISNVVVGARRPLASACRLRPPLSRCGGLGSSLQLQHFPGWHKQAVQCMDVGKALPPQVRTDRNECYQPYLAGDTAVLLQRALTVRRLAAQACTAASAGRCRWRPRCWSCASAPCGSSSQRSGRAAPASHAVLDIFFFTLWLARLRE